MPIVTLPVFYRLILAVSCLLVAGTARPLAGQDSTGVLQVRVLSGVDSTPLTGAFVRSGRVSAVTDQAGVVKLRLAATLSKVAVSHPAFDPRSFEMTILAGLSQRAEIYLPTRSGVGVAAIDVTRAGVTPSEEPAPVALLGAERITAAIESHPGDITGLFTTPTIRVQAMSGPLDATRLRIHGLRGQYTGLYIDGLPLYGSRLGSFELQQLTAIDLEGAEILTGTGTPLYGPGAGAGVINLVSRRPERDQIRLAVDQSSEKGGDIAFWGARRFSPTTGATLLTDFHQQRLVDADDDGWGEFPRAIRLAVRPRLTIETPRGDGLMATIGGLSEDRTGGLLAGTNDPNPYREERQTRRIDGGLTAHHLDLSGARWEARIMTAFQSTSHRFEALRERDRRTFVFTELSYRRPLGSAAVVAGLAYQRETLRQRDFPAFDYTHSVPAVFGRVTVPIGDRLVAAVMARCDEHNIHGTQCMPRASVLIRAGPTTDLRVSAGEGYVAPTPLTDDVEAIGLHATLPVTAKAERFRTASIDAKTVRGDLTVSAMIAYSRVKLPVRLVPFPGDGARRLRLLNISEPTRVFAGELNATVVRVPFRVQGYYGFLDGTEGVPNGVGRRETDLTPRHTVGANVNWQPQLPAAPSVEVDLGYLGSQALYDNPFRTRAPAYARLRGVASVRSGKARLFLSGENLLDKNLRDYQAVVLGEIQEGGRRTTSPWVPLRGRVINIGAVVDW